VSAWELGNAHLLMQEQQSVELSAVRDTAAEWIYLPGLPANRDLHLLTVVVRSDVNQPGVLLDTTYDKRWRRRDLLVPWPVDAQELLWPADERSVFVHVTASSGQRNARGQRPIPDYLRLQELDLRQPRDAPRYRSSCTGDNRVCRLRPVLSNPGEWRPPLGIDSCLVGGYVNTSREQILDRSFPLADRDAGAEGTNAIKGLDEEFGSQIGSFVLEMGARSR
jgi:hypothetical protein